MSSSADSFERLMLGWDIICANQVAVINQKINALYNENILPNHFKGIHISCPEIIGGVTNKPNVLKVRFVLEGKISLIKVSEVCELTINLDDLGARLDYLGGTIYTITISFDADKQEDLFQNFDILDVDSKLIENGILEILNGIFSKIPDISFEIDAPIPALSLKNAVAELAFIEHPESHRSFLAVLINLEGNRGSYDLLSVFPKIPAITTVFMLSQKVVMLSAQKFLNFVAEEYDFQVSDTNSLTLTNQHPRNLLEANDWNFQVEIDKHDILVTFLENIIEVDIRVNYQLTSFLDWQKLDLKFYTEIEAKAGKLSVTVTYFEEPPAWLWVILFPIALLQNLAHEGKTFTFEIPDFQLTQIHLSDYLQLAGSWK